MTKQVGEHKDSARNPQGAALLPDGRCVMHGTQSSRRDHQPSTPRFTLAYYDIETRSELDLKDVGGYVYAADKTTEARCVA